MRFLIFFFVFLYAFSRCNAQSIEGTVSDAQTGEPLPFVALFFDNTAIATETDSVGKFVFQKLPSGDYTLVVRFVGYEVFSQKVSIKNNAPLSLKISLKADPKQLNEVRVTAKRDTKWLKNFRVFEREFLGEGEAAKSCKILNPWVLAFEMENGTLKAKSSASLEIDNQYLGYKIYYTLQYFSYDGAQVGFGGYAQFDPYLSHDPIQKKQWQTNRENAYQTSDLYFFRSLIKQQHSQFEAFLDKAGEDPTRRSPYFHQNQSKKLQKIALDDLVDTVNTSALYALRVPDRLEVHLNGQQGDYAIYKDKICQVFWLESSTSSVQFNRDGVVLNPQSCAFSGYIVSKRLANMLPLDFEMPLTSYPMPPQEWDKQTETPLFNLDRPYYFSKDKIGIKGIMQYQNPAFGDSLSGVLYIDVVNAITQKVVVKQPVKIHQGFFETQISFSDSVAIATPYWIRAYTQWMLNFGDSSYAFREIGVIPEGYNLKHEQKWENSGNIPLSLSVYSNSVEDSVEILLPASVQNKVLWATVAVRNKQIVGSNMDYWSAPHFGAFKPLYQPAKTLHVAGRMLKPTIRKAGSAILFFPRQGATFFANIVANGTFRFDNIEIDSTQEAIFQFNDAKGNPIENPKVVFDDPPTPQWLPTVLEKKKEAQMVVEKIQNNWPREGVLLEEVTVKSSKVIRPLQSIYKEADYVVQGKDLFDKAVGTNILTAIQGRVPGLRIVEFPDEVGLPKLVLTMRMGASVGGFNKTTLAQPLVLVDGIPFENINQLANLSPTIVERIEVVNRAEALLGLRGYVGVISVITKNGLKNGNFTTTSASSMTQKTIMGYISPSSTPFWQVLDTSKPLKIRKPSYPFYVVVEGVLRTGELFRTYLQ